MRLAGELELIGSEEAHRQQGCRREDHQAYNRPQRAFRLCAAALHRAGLLQDQANNHDGDRHGAFAGQDHHPGKNPFAALLRHHLVNIRNEAVDIPRYVIEACSGGAQQDKDRREQQRGHLGFGQVDRKQEHQHEEYPAVREAQSGRRGDIQPVQQQHKSICARYRGESRNAQPAGDGCRVLAQTIHDIIGKDRTEYVHRRK